MVHVIYIAIIITASYMLYKLGYKNGFSRGESFAEILGTAQSSDLDFAKKTFKSSQIDKIISPGSGEVN